MNIHERSANIRCVQSIIPTPQPNNPDLKRAVRYSVGRLPQPSGALPESQRMFTEAKRMLGEALEMLAEPAEMCPKPERMFGKGQRMLGGREGMLKRGGVDSQSRKEVSAR